MNTNTESKKESQSTLTTLFGGVDFQVIYEDGTGETVRVRQLRLVEYEKAWPLISDEFAIAAFCASLPATPSVPCTKEWAMKLHPAIYEKLLAKVREVNEEGFFTFAARKQAAQEEIDLRFIKQAAELPPEFLVEAMRLGTTISPQSSPRPRTILK
jgi:hypothetical protein